MKKHVLFLFATLLSLVASAHDFEVDGIYYSITSPTDRTVEVTFKGYYYDSYTNEYSGYITIPATVTYNGVNYSVTSIGDWAFVYCSSLNAITFPEDSKLTSIGSHAFYDCSSLAAITIPEGVTSIGGSAFYECSSLTDITLPDGVTSIGGSAFYGTEWYNNQPDGAVYIGKVLYNYKGTMPENTAIEVKEGTVSISPYAFSSCSSLTAITIPESVTSIGEGAFSGCSSLTAITIPEGVTSIGDWAFGGCSSLTAINIPEGVTSIGSSAFRYCSSLTTITIPEGVTSIGREAFYDCSSLTTITIHKGVTSIGESAFYGCSSLAAITLPEGVTSIGSHAFYDCSSLTAIALPEGVTSIGNSAFQGCFSLTAINIPEGVTSIENRVFSSCTSLTAITLPESVTSIGNYAFNGCSSLTSIILPKSVSRINSNAFANCPELTDVYCYAESVPSTVTDAFDGSYPEYATLHVPASSINSYKTRAPWSSFGKIIAPGASITEITLSESSATLTEGEDLTLTMTTNPENADRNVISWSSSNPRVATVDNTGKVTAIAPGTATITAMANDGSGVSASCEVMVQKLILGKCATPTISYVDGKISLTCDTEDATIRSSVRDNNIGDYEVTEYNVIPTYTITAYATKEKYEDSDVATLTLCWVPCKEDHEEDNGILTIPAKPVLISTQGGTITLSGLAEGTAVAAYSTAGTELATATATNGTATLTTDLTVDSIAIVKIGEHSIKVAIK